MSDLADRIRDLAESIHDLRARRERLGREAQESNVLSEEEEQEILGNIDRRIERLQARLDEWRARYNDVQSDERQWFDANASARVSRQSDGSLLLWNFGLGSTALVTAHVSALARFIREARGTDGAALGGRWIVEGRASSGGEANNNQNIARERARSVTNEMQHLNVDASNIDTVLPSDPLGSESDPRGMAMNRSVRVIYTTSAQNRAQRVDDRTRQNAVQMVTHQLNKQGIRVSEVNLPNLWTPTHTKCHPFSCPT